ncbi:C-type lectin domain-containing protein [Haloferula sp. A504]|uniref:C-type lectin domain-containing protein n=1 Tax=Haloferula sp. A504 TaxID=3373601 RepID=UPI0031C3FF10|nr:C-type lectin domain-containing protein [Verrucomicrobiaceae bacterium E54]
MPRSEPFPRSVSRLLRLGALFLLLLAPARARSLDDLQKTFMENYDALNLERDQRLEKLSGGYLQVLERLMDQAAAAGRLEAALPIRDEIETVREGNGRLEDLPDTSPDSLKENRGKYVAARKKIDDDHARELVELAGRMEKLLKQEEVELTRAKKLDQAVAVKRMREVLAEDAGLERARERMASLGEGRAPGVADGIPPEIKKQVFTVGKTTYYLFPDPMTHAEATAACGKIGGSLLSIGGKAEYDHFHGYSVEHRKALWIDLQDEEEDGDWRHADGTRARFLKWQAGEPNGGDAQKHVMIGHQGSWDMRDVNPDEKFHVICEW